VYCFNSSVIKLLDYTSSQNNAVEYTSQNYTTKFTAKYTKK